MQNVPLDFAREHFCRLGKTTDVVLQLYHIEFKAKLKIKTYDGKMVQCFIKDGVNAMIDEYKVQVDEGAVIELLQLNPIVLYINLQLSTDS